MNNKEIKHLHKSLAEKWGKLIEIIDVAGGKTTPFYDDGEDMQEAAIEEINRLKSQPIALDRLMKACPRDVIKKLSCHDLKRITDNYNRIGANMKPSRHKN